MWLGCNDILILVLFIQFRSLSSWCLTWFETICASLPSTRIHISVLDVMPKSCQAGVVNIGDTHISNSSARQISCLPFGHFHSSRVGKIMPQSNVSWTIRKRNKTRWWWWCASVDFTLLGWTCLSWHEYIKHVVLKLFMNFIEQILWHLHPPANGQCPKF